MATEKQAGNGILERATVAYYGLKWAYHTKIDLVAFLRQRNRITAEEHKKLNASYLKEHREMYDRPIKTEVDIKALEKDAKKAVGDAKKMNVARVLANLNRL